MSDVNVRGSHLPFYERFPMRLVLGLTKPRNPIPGNVMSGEIESVGKDVTRFRKGDRVYGFTDFKFGAYAEYLCMPENESGAGCLAMKPADMSYEEAASIPFGGLFAMHYVNRGEIKRGQKVLVYGASGAMGTIAVQLARHYGAVVTGVCSTANLEMVKSLGADVVIDYTKEDSLNKGEFYDFILDAAGKKKKSKLKMQCRNAIAPNGKYISVDDGIPKLSSESLVVLKDLIDRGYLKAVIDRCYPMEQIVEAHRYVDRGHKKGNVVITVKHNDKA